MSFVDKVTVNAQAGRGGDGKLSFRREKFIDKGGPNGGDGGKGGDVVLQASPNQNTLAAFRYHKELKADSGQPGGKSRKHGRNGADLIVAVPVGTIATTDGQVVADLIEAGQTAVIAHGGRGGYGNAHFVSSRRQTPKFAEKGEPGEAAQIQLELKMIADVGLVGLPNAGKSTLLSKLSNARPEIADYPFTTLTPNLGVVDIDKHTSLLFADIPGLIEGAAEGKGLGHDFLKHVERTAVILHMIDAYHEDVAASYHIVRAELEAYQPELIKRPEVIALNKIEGLDDAIVHDLVTQLRQAAPADTPIFAVSAQAGLGLQPLLFAIKEAVQTARRRQTIGEPAEPTVPVLTLPDSTSAWQVRKQKDTFVVSGTKIEQFAARTDFGNPQAVQRLRDIMRRQGIMHELSRRGIQAGQPVQFGEQRERLEY